MENKSNLPISIIEEVLTSIGEKTNNVLYGLYIPIIEDDICEIRASYHLNVGSNKGRGKLLFNVKYHIENNYPLIELINYDYINNEEIYIENITNGDEFKLKIKEMLESFEFQESICNLINEIKYK